MAPERTTRRGQVYRQLDTEPSIWVTDFGSISWQSAPVPEVGRNGYQPQELLDLVDERLRELNAAVPSRETSLAITEIETAILWLDERTRNRVARGVEGTHQP